MRMRLSLVKLLWTAMIAIALASSWSASTRGSGGPDEPVSTKPVALERQVYEAFVRGEYQQAVALIRQHLQGSPNDHDMLYNLACAHSMLRQYDDAASALLKAFRAGFGDFEHMRSDPDLQGLREHPTYKRILEEADKASHRVSRNALEHWREAYGAEDYRYESDSTRRLNYAVALDDEAFAGVRRMLEKQADQMTRLLFDEQAPAYDILIAIPTPDDSDQFFNGQDDIGGMYQHSMRRLVARDVGGSLRHEFFHALHYAHMERIRQRHPLWIQEGLATLYEDYEIDDGGQIRFVPNDRQFIVKSRARAGRLIKWSGAGGLFKMNAEAFMAQAQRNYPQVRSVFEFLAEQGKLADWYRAYVKTYIDDPSSAKAFEEVFAQPLEDIERAWRKWVLEQPTIDLRIGEGDAALGIRSDENLSNDGVLITDIIPGSTAARSRLRRGDVIVSVDGRATPTVLDLRRIIATREVGDEIEVKVRRNGEYFTIRAALRPLAGGF
jgi:hypothetical protein